MAEQAFLLNHTLGFTTQLTAINLADETQQSCQKPWHSFCLDGTSLDGADVAGIITGGVIFVVLVILVAAYVIVRMRKRSHPAQA